MNNVIAVSDTAVYRIPRLYLPNTEASRCGIEYQQQEI